MNSTNLENNNFINTNTVEPPVTDTLLGGHHHLEDIGPIECNGLNKYIKTSIKGVFTGVDLLHAGIFTSNTRVNG